MKTRHGCLIVLLAVALMGAYTTWTAGGDDGDGVKLVFALAFGLVVVLVGGALEWLTTRSKKERRGFPVEPRSPEEEQ